MLFEFLMKSEISFLNFFAYGIVYIGVMRSSHQHSWREGIMTNKEIASAIISVKGGSLPPRKIPGIVKDGLLNLSSSSSDNLVTIKSRHSGVFAVLSCGYVLSGYGTVKKLTSKRI